MLPLATAAFLVAFATALPAISPPDTGARAFAYGGFLVLVAICLALDLGVFHREARETTAREAAAWSCLWIGLSLSFAAFVYFAYDRHWFALGLDVPIANATGGVTNGTVSGIEAVQQYLTGYVVEFSLAMDNILVIAIVLTSFGIPPRYQHRLLFWGIVGAVAMRGGMIWLGAELVQRHTWLLIVFGLFLLLTAIKLALVHGEPDPRGNLLVRLARRLLPIVTFHDGEKFFTRRTVPPTYSIDPATGRPRRDPPPPGTLGKLALTPACLALIAVETSDLIFAVDSIPAIFAVTLDPFLVFTSNVFAILGLRSLYFCLAAALARFRYLQPGLVLVLGFIGVKLLLLALPPHLDDLGGLVGLELATRAPIKIDTLTSLLVIVAVLGGALLLSVLNPRRRSALPH